VLKSGRTTGEDSGPPALETIEETAEDDEVSLGSSEAEMDFTRLNEETQHAAQDVRFDRESSVAVAFTVLPSFILPNMAGTKSAM
jgi:hypothetical protein